MMTRNRILIWAVLILLAVNIATVISALRYSGRVRSDELARSEAMADARVMFFTERLQLDERQNREFIQLNRTFNQRAGRKASRLDVLRRNMIEELARPEPDMEKVGSITEEIGLVHSALKQETATYYLDLKNVCTPEQQERLREMFMVMSDPESDINQLRRGQMGPGPAERGRMRGMGRGRGGRF
jgi:hypothetical protein